MSIDLHAISTEKLRGIQLSLRNQTGAVTSGPLLGHIEYLHAKQLAGGFEGMSADAVAQLLDVVIRDREAREVPSPKLVYSGPAVEGSYPRLTQGAMAELLSLATREVLIAGYSFDHTEDIFAPLAKQLEAKPEIELTMFINLDQDAGYGQRTPEQTDEDAVRCTAEKRAAKAWPFNVGNPKFFYDSRYIRANEFFSMHAKCVVIDRRHTLVGSANFTDRAQSRNVEVGVLLRDDAEFATTLVEHFEGLVKQGRFLGL